MKPFRSLPIEILTEAEKETLVNVVFSNPHKLTGFGMINGGLSELNFYNGNFYIPAAIDRLRGRFTIPFNISILHTPPKAKIPRHRDTNTKDRQCSIIVPVYPKTRYAPTFFWEDLISAAPSAVLTMKLAPALVNLQALHSVANFDTHRFNFQLSFSQPYEEVLGMLDAGTLLR